MRIYLNIFIMLAWLSKPVYAQNVMVDAQELVKNLRSRMSSDKEFPLQGVVESFRIKAKTTNVKPIMNGRGNCKWPNTKPEGIDKKEWRALKSSVDPGIGENNCDTYTFVDMNGDGKRDIFQRNYSGGTGLFTNYFAWKRAGNAFILDKSSQVNNSSDEGYELFATNDRGANQWFDFITINGRFYIAYVEGAFGTDTVTLMRPFKARESLVAFEISYRYQFSVPLEQNFGSDGKSKVVINETLQKTLLDAINKHVGNSSPAKGCPVPINSPEDERSSYESYGAGHYSVEVVGNFPVWLNNECHIAQLIDWFGRYTDKDGLHAMLSVKKPLSGNESDYDVRASRSAIKVSDPILVKQSGN